VCVCVCVCVCVSVPRDSFFFWEFLIFSRLFFVFPNNLISGVYKWMYKEKCIRDCHFFGTFFFGNF